MSQMGHERPANHAEEPSA